MGYIITKINKEFIKKAHGMRIVSENHLKNAYARFNDSKEIGISKDDEQIQLNDEAFENSLSIELAYKLLFLIDDISKLSEFNCEVVGQIGKDGIELPVVGSKGWHDRISEILRKPINMLNLIKSNYNNDIRNDVEMDKKATGHLLDVYYRLQKLSTQDLIKVVYYTYTSDELNYILYAYLTGEIDQNFEGSGMEQGLSENKNGSVNFRYSSISNENVETKWSDYLRCFAEIMSSVVKFRFNEDYYMNDELKNKYATIEEYYYETLLSDMEKETFKEYLLENKTTIENEETFLNIVLFIKKYFNDIKLTFLFTKEELSNINKLIKDIKSFDPTNADSIRLCDISEIESKRGKILQKMRTTIWIQQQRKNSKEYNINDKLNILESNWNKMYELAKKYYEEHGNLDISRRYQTPTGENLGVWISHQRKTYKNGRLEQNQIDKLNSIGMQWTINNPKKEKAILEATKIDLKYKAKNLNEEELYNENNKTINDYWNEMYELAKRYYEEHGNLDIPQRYQTSTGENLGSWISYQRRAYKDYINGEKTQSSVIMQDQIDKLNDIGMIWDVLGYQWNSMYELAKQYYEEHGNLDIPQRYQTSTGENLGSWISYQRRAYKNYISGEEKSNIVITQDQINKLESIGMIWDAKGLGRQK